MPLAYVGLTVRISGLSGGRGSATETPDDIRRRVEAVLVKEFDPEFESDIQVILDESAGS